MYEFRHKHCVDLFPRRSKEKIEADIAECGWKLPESYFAFLLQHNGMRYSGRRHGLLLAYQRSMGVVSAPDGFELYFKKWPPNDLYYDFCGFVDELYGVPVNNDSFDLRQEQNAYGFRNCVPENFLSIGCSCQMSTLVICTSGPWAGMIFHWTPSEDSHLPEEQHTIERLQFVAMDFSTFWGSLAEIPSTSLKL